MKILIGCEESQAVCIAFRERGFEAYSCDLQDCSGGHPEWHLRMDVFEAISKIKPILLIAHPPCTYLSFAGNRWFNYLRYGEKAIERNRQRHEAIKFFTDLWNVKVEHIAIENPRGYIQLFIPQSQIIQPYYFGDSQSKTTLLWLKNLPHLQHEKINNLFGNKTHVDKGVMAEHGSGSEEFFGLALLKLPQSERAKIRSKTFPGIAKAMAEQWGDYLKQQLTHP